SGASALAVGEEKPGNDVLMPKPLNDTEHLPIVPLADNVLRYDECCLGVQESQWYPYIDLNQNRKHQLSYRCLRPTASIFTCRALPVVRCIRVHWRLALMHRFC